MLSGRKRGSPTEVSPSYLNRRSIAQIGRTLTAVSHAIAPEASAHVDKYVRISLQPFKGQSIPGNLLSNVVISILAIAVDSRPCALPHSGDLVANAQR